MLNPLVILGALGVGAFALYQHNGSSNPAAAQNPAANQLSSKGGSLTLPSISAQIPPAVQQIPVPVVQPNTPPQPILPGTDPISNAVNAVASTVDDILNAATAAGQFPVTAVVTTDTDPLNVRPSPATTGTPVGQFAKGAHVLITGPAVIGDASQAGGWAPVSGQDANTGASISGYASMAYLDTGS